MITLKKAEAAERKIITGAKNFCTTYPVFTAFVLVLVVLFTFVAINIIMLFAAVGGGTIEHNAREQVISGDMSYPDYVNLIHVLNVGVFFYNYLAIAMRLVLTAILIFLIYIAYKEYLIYKHDNL